MATIEEIEKERATRKAGLAEQRKVQAAIDLDALNEAEKDHGDGSVQRVELHAMRFIPGLPTMVVVKMPEPAATKRYSDRLAANVPNATAAQEVGDLCVVYPDKETYAKMKSAVSTLHLRVSMAAIRISEGRAAEEGKD